MNLPKKIETLKKLNLRKIETSKKLKLQKNWNFKKIETQKRLKVLKIKTLKWSKKKFKTNCVKIYKNWKHSHWGLIICDLENWKIQKLYIIVYTFIL